MDMINVYVLFDIRNITRDEIMKDLAEENFKHKFCFCNPKVKSADVEALKFANEIWCFGECEYLVEYQIAKEMGLDIWQMG